MIATPSNIINNLRCKRFTLRNEKVLQEELYEYLFEINRPAKEYRLDPKNVIDFYFPDEKIGIEVKVKGSAKQIYKQLERYCEFDDIECIILVTSKSMGLPREIKGKKVYYLSLSEAWL